MWKTDLHSIHTYNSSTDSLYIEETVFNFSQFHSLHMTCHQKAHSLSFKWVPYLHCSSLSLSLPILSFICYIIMKMPYLNVHTVNDYVVNIQNLSSRVFTVVFQSKQANSTEHVIFLVEDTLFEGSEFFRLQIVAARFIGQAAFLFRAVDILNNTFVDVHIVDDDCELNGIIIYWRAYAN